MEKYESYITFSEFIGGLIIGLGIQFLFLTIDISSSFTSNVSKIIPTFVFVGLLILFNNYLFIPNDFEKFLLSRKENNDNPYKKSVSLFHFIILGVLFIFSMMLILNPMALSAYDIVNLTINGLIPNSMNVWPSYGFTYYIFLIFLTVIASYVVIMKFILTLSQKIIKIIFISSIGATGILTGFGIFIIENDFSILSSIYISLITVIGVFGIVLYISYLFSFYTFNSSITLLKGIFIFFLTVFFFIILHVEILWEEYISLLSHLLIQIITGAAIIVIFEIKNLNISLKLKERSIHISKPIVISFIGIFVIYGISLGVAINVRRLESVTNPNPTSMIWNIHNAIGDDDIFSLDRIVNDIKENDPDILGLNEVDLGAIKTSFIDLPSYFAHRLNMYYFYGYTFYKHEGNVILSKYPILEAEVIPLPLAITSERPRSLIKAKIEINSLIWTIYLTHLSTSSEDRLIQVPFIINEIQKEVSFENIVWMGDFNLEPTSTEYSLINSTSSLNFTDTYRFLNSDAGYTGHFDDNHIPHKRIDYIMCSPDLLPTFSEVYCSISSDHCAVITQF
jgi:endonuclease/exonuclease/phosphatase family metal-dependent hydrolase